MLTFKTLDISVHHHHDHLHRPNQEHLKFKESKEVQRSLIGTLILELSLTENVLPEHHTFTQNQYFSADTTVL